MSRYKSNAQKKYLADFMQAHPNLANNFIRGDRNVSKVLWNQLTNELNRKGPPRRNTIGWKKIWADWKNYIRKKVSQNIGESNPKCYLTTSEDMIAKLCGFYNMLAFPDISANKSDEDNIFKSDETEIEVVWSEETTETNKEIESLWSEDITAPETIKGESAQHSDTDDFDSAPIKCERADAESILSEEEIAASSTAVCASSRRRRKHETPTLASVQKHMASEVNAMQSIAKSSQNFLKYSQDNTEALEEGNNGILRVYSSLSKLTELIAEQNALIDQRNKDQRNHFMTMQRSAEEKVKIKEKFFEIEKLKFERENQQLSEIIKRKRITKEL